MVTKIILGNICRSPIAEGVFNHILNERNLVEQWVVDSAATGSWHTGSPPDHRALATMKKNNIPYDNTARTVHKFHHKPNPKLIYIIVDT